MITFEEDCIVSYNLTDIPETISYKRLVTPLIQEAQNLNERVKFLEENCILK